MGALSGRFEVARSRGRAALGIATLLAVSALGGCAGRERDSAHRAAPARLQDEPFAVGAFAYGTYCAVCHGTDATGYAADHAPSLVSATFLESAPDDFIIRAIREGRPGTAMASYAKARGGPLDDEQMRAVVHFLRSFGGERQQLPPAGQGDPAQGEEIYAASCKPCHGTRDDRGFAVHLANSTFLGGASDPFLRYAVLRGRPGTPMPSFRGALSESQIDDVVALLRSWAASSRERAQPVGAREPPALGQVVINPGGKQPAFKLREERFVAMDDVKRALDAKQRIVIIDARAASDWFALHIPGSISVPYYLLSRLDAVPRDGTWVVAYCACPHHVSGVVVDELRKRGYPHTAVLDEGILAWKKQGYPIEGESP